MPLGGTPVTLVPESGPAYSDTNPLPVRIPVDPDGDPEVDAVAAANLDARTTHEILASIDDKLGALLLLHINVFGAKDRVDQLIDAANSLRTLS